MTPLTALTSFSTLLLHCYSSIILHATVQYSSIILHATVHLTKAKRRLPDTVIATIFCMIRGAAF
jgi:hypothetical protein